MISEEVLMDMYVNKGMSLVDIGRELNVTPPAIYYWMHKYQIDTRCYVSSYHVLISKKELEDMYLNKKMSMYEIATEFNTTFRIIYYWMRKYGIERRSGPEILKGKPNLSVRGKLHGNWKGGISPTPYCYKFNFSFKKLIRMRDDNTCQLCDYVPGLDNIKLSIHHIHYDKPNCYPDVITLCNSCNTRVNSDRDYWEKYFENLLRSRGLLMEV